MQKATFYSLLKVLVPALAGALASVSIARINAKSDFEKAKLGVEAVAGFEEETRKSDLARDKELAEQRGRIDLLEKGFVAVIGHGQPIGVGSLGTLGAGSSRVDTGRVGSSRVRAPAAGPPAAMPLIPMKAIPRKFDDIVQQRKAD